MQDIIQGSPEWLELRKTKITSTDAATILGISPFDNPYNLWMRKMGLMPAIPETEAMRRGRELEPLALKKLEEHIGIKMSPKIVVSHDNPWMMASLDAITKDGKKMGEIKCSEKSYIDCKNNICPSYYYCQIQHALSVTCNYCSYYACYWDEAIAIMEIERDDEFIKNMIESEREFYRRMIEFDPPEPKHKKVESDEMRSVVERYKYCLEMKIMYELDLELAKAEIQEIAQGECIEGYGLKYTTFAQKGRVDYSQIPELKGVDLDKYRKPKTTKSMIKV